MANIRRKPKSSSFSIDQNDGGGEEALRNWNTDSEASRITTEYVRLNQIVRDESQGRRLNLSFEELTQAPSELADKTKAAELEAIQTLARDIAAQGLENPISVYPSGASTYTIVTGERRWWALQYNWRIRSDGAPPPDVRVTLYKKRPDALRRKQFSENAQRRKLSLPDTMLSVELALQEINDERSQAGESAISSIREFQQALFLSYAEARTWWHVFFDETGELKQAVASGECETVNALRDLIEERGTKLKRGARHEAGEKETATKAAKPRAKTRAGNVKIQLTHAEAFAACERLARMAPDAATSLPPEDDEAAIADFIRQSLLGTNG